MAVQTAGSIGVNTDEITIFEDPDGVSSVLICNGSAGLNDILFVHVEGLHASGEYFQMDPLGFGAQKVDFAVFTIKPRGIKKITAKRGSATGQLAYFQTMER
jgi:hypothetical protein